MTTYLVLTGHNFHDFHHRRQHHHHLWLKESIIGWSISIPTDKAEAERPRATWVVSQVGALADKYFLSFEKYFFYFDKYFLIVFSYFWNTLILTNKA